MPTTFHLKRRVQFSETDMAGVLHFANYYRMMEEVEHAFWRAQGHSVMVADGDAHISWPRVATHCEYFAPARFEDELDIAMTVAQVSEKSVTYQMNFTCRGEAIASGRIKAVCCQVGLGSFSSIPIPSELRKILETEA